MKRGDHIGAWVVQDQLGRGTMGVVHLVINGQTGQPGALKLLAPEALEDAQAHERFGRELRSQGSLQHPAIVGVLDAGRTRHNEPWFVMQLVDGPSLKQALKEGLPLNQGLEAVEAIARGLHHAHVAGFIHRDVKPQNILISDEGARLTDFGLVRGLMASKGLTMAGDIVGTVAYMAPEQASPDRGDPGPWTDAYSLGAVLYEVLTGSPPLKAESAVHMITKLLLEDTNLEIVPPSQANPEAKINKSLDFICLRALRRDPRERYQSLEEFADDLAKARPEVDIRKPLGSSSKIRVPEIGMTVVEEDEPSQTLTESAVVAIEEEEQDDPRVRILGLVAVLAIVLVAALGYTVISMRSGPGLGEEAVLEARVARLRKQLDESRFDDVIRGAQELLDTEAEPLPRVEELLASAHEGRMRGAFMALDPQGARALMPDGWDRYFPELPWILALSGDLDSAAKVCRDDVAPEQRARLAAWSGNVELCQTALSELDGERALALTWELSRYLPQLQPPASEFSLPIPSRGWAAAAVGEEALARGVVSIAAVAFDNARQGADGDALRLTALVGLLRVWVARGDLEQAGERASDAYLLARHPLDRARTLGWAAQITVASGAPIVHMQQQLGEAGAVDEARGYAPTVPLVAAASRQAAALIALDQQGPQAALPPGMHPGIERLVRARDRRRQQEALDDPAWSGPAFAGAEQRLCASGADGAPGILLARGCELARLAERGGVRGGASLAVGLLKAATRLRPGSPAAWEGLARAHLVLHQADDALRAAQRACALSPEDPEALLLLARAQRAGLEEDTLAAGRAKLVGGAPEALARDLDQRLAPCVETLEQALALAEPGTPLERAVRLDLAGTLLHGARLRAWAGDDPGGDLAQRLRPVLAPLLKGVDVQAIAKARAELLEALGGDDAQVIGRAEFGLARLGAPVSDDQLAALHLEASLPGATSAAHAYVALAGDLPARALLALRRSERLEGPERERELERAHTLAPRLPPVELAVELARGAGRDAASFRTLVDLLERAPEWHTVLTGVVYLSKDRLPAKDLRAFEPGDSDEATELLARAVFLRTLRVFGEQPNDLEADELARAEREHDRVSTRGTLLVSQALQRRPDSVVGHLLRAMLQSSMALGSPWQARQDARIKPDVDHDLACARSGAPWASAVFLYHLHWLPKQVPETVEELLTHGFTTNAQALLKNTHSDVVRRVLQPAAELLPALGPEGDPAEALKLARFLGNGEALRNLGLAIGLELADRPQPDSAWLDAVSGGGTVTGESLFGPRPHVELLVRARLNLGLARSQEASGLLREAGTSAWRALILGMPAGGLLGPGARDLRAIEVRPRLPESIPYGDRIVESGLPGHPGLWASWYALHQPAAALEWLSQAVADSAEHTPASDPCGDLFEAWGRPRAWSLSLQESSAQERAVGWLLARSQWEEALATSTRAAAFARAAAPAKVLAHLISDQLRPYALASEGEARAARLRQLYLLVARSLALADDREPLKALGLQLRDDLRGGD